MVTKRSVHGAMAAASLGDRLLSLYLLLFLKSSRFFFQEKPFLERDTGCNRSCR